MLSQLAPHVNSGPTFCYHYIFLDCTAVKVQEDRSLRALGGPRACLPYNGLRQRRLAPNQRPVASNKRTHNCTPTCRQCVSMRRNTVGIGRVTPTDSLRHTSSLGPQGITGCRDRSSWFAALPRLALKPWSRMVSVFYSTPVSLFYIFNMLPHAIRMPRAERPRPRYGGPSGSNLRRGHP